MEAEKFIHMKTEEYLIKRGYTPIQAIKAADFIIDQFQKGQLPSGDFLKMAENYACSHFGKPKE